MEFDNSPSRSIIRFTASARAADSSFNLKLGNEPFTNLQLHLDGSEPLIGDLNRDLEARLAAMRPWYAILTRGDIVLIGLLSLLAVVLISAALIGFGLLLESQAPAPPSDPRRELRSLALAWGIAGAWGLFAWVLSVVRARLFPIGAFVLGAGRSRYDVLEKIRWTVVVGFVVSVVASFAVAWFAY
jgi:hypothetical protein